MREIYWAKTTLSVQRYLDKIIGAIDKMVDKRALASFYIAGNGFAQNNVYAACQGIIDLGERKKTLLSLKYLINDALVSIEDDSLADLLVMRYIESIKPKAICKQKDMPERTYFRKIKNAELQYSRALERLGFKEDDLAKMLAKERWVCEVHRSIVEGLEEINFGRIKRLAEAE